MTATAMKIALERMQAIELIVVTNVSPNFSHAGQSVVSTASSCEHGICSHGLNTSSSSCWLSTDVTFTAFATNVLGDGLSPEPIRVFLFSHVQCSYLPLMNNTDDITLLDMGW